MLPFACIRTQIVSNFPCIYLIFISPGLPVFVIGVKNSQIIFIIKVSSQVKTVKRTFQASTFNKLEQTDKFIVIKPAGFPGHKLFIILGIYGYGLV